MGSSRQRSNLSSWRLRLPAEAPTTLSLARAAHRSAEQRGGGGEATRAGTRLVPHRGRGPAWPAGRHALADGVVFGPNRERVPGRTCNDAADPMSGCSRPRSKSENGVAGPSYGSFIGRILGRVEASWTEERSNRVTSLIASAASPRADQDSGSRLAPRRTALPVPLRAALRKAPTSVPHSGGESWRFTSTHTRYPTAIIAAVITTKVVSLRSTAAGGAKRGQGESSRQTGRCAALQGAAAGCTTGRVRGNSER